MNAPPRLLLPMSARGGALRWSAPLPFCDLVTGAPMPGAAALAWEAEALWVRLESTRAAERPRLGLLLDPVGDGLGFFEFAASLIEGEPLAQTVFRRAPSGYKRDWRWQCEGAGFTREGNQVVLSLPFAGFGSTLPGRGWRLNLFETTPGGRSASWSPVGWNTLYQPDRFGLVDLVGGEIPPKAGMKG